MLHHDEDGQEHDAGDSEDGDRRRNPGVGGAPEGGEQHQTGGRASEQNGAEVVDDVVDPGEGTRQHDGGHHQGDGSDRQVDVEDPPPGQVGHDEPTDQGADDTGHPEHGAEEAHVAAPFARRDNIADDRLGSDHEPTSSNALEGPECDQLEHRGAQPGEDGANEEDDDGGLEEALATVEVPELAPQRSGGRGGEQVSGHHPGQVRKPVQVTGDGRQRGGDDGLVQRGQHHSQQEAADDHQHPALADGRAVV